MWFASLSSRFHCEAKFNAKGLKGNRPSNKFLVPFEIRMSALLVVAAKYSKSSHFFVSKVNESLEKKRRKSKPF